MTSSVASFFSDQANAYADVYEENTIYGYFLRRRRDLTFPIIDQEPTTSLLDVGCGAGTYASRCLERGLSYVGVDLSPAMIDFCRARNRNRNVAFEVGDVLKLPFADEQFDAILCLGVLEYVPRADHEAALTELIRVAKHGQRIIFSFANPRSPYRRWIAFRNHGAGSGEAGNCDFRPEEYERLLSSAGLAIEKTVPCAINLSIPPIARRWPGLVVKATRFLDQHASWLAGRYAMAHIVVARTAA